MAEIWAVLHEAVPVNKVSIVSCLFTCRAILTWGTQQTAPAFQLSVTVARKTSSILVFAVLRLVASTCWLKQGSVVAWSPSSCLCCYVCLLSFSLMVLEEQAFVSLKKSQVSRLSCCAVPLSDSIWSLCPAGFQGTLLCAEGQCCDPLWYPALLHGAVWHVEGSGPVLYRLGSPLVPVV